MRRGCCASQWQGSGRTGEFARAGAVRQHSAARSDAAQRGPAGDWAHPTLEDSQMAYSSILGAETAPTQPSGRDADLLGPSDNSDSGSDAIGTAEGQADSDASGT